MIAATMQPPPVHYVTTKDGFSIAYTVRGEGLPLVCLPFVFNHVQMVWGRTVVGSWHQALGSRYRVVHYDGRGQGLSTRHLSNETSVADFQRDLEAVIGHLHFDQVTLFATGPMGHVALGYALEHPDRVSAIVLSCCPVDAAVWGARSLYENLLDEDWEMFLRTRAVPGILLDDLGRELEFFKQASDPADFRVRLRALRASDLRSVLPRLRAPTLVLHSRQFADLAEQESARLAAAIPDARLVLIDGAFLVGDVRQGMQALDAFTAEIRARSGAASSTLAPPLGLSPRQMQVLRLIAEGKTNGEIADTLVISLRTVERHVAELYAKIGARNRVEAASFAISQIAKA